MRKIILGAVESQKAHLAHCSPVTEGQGLKEANIAFSISYAFRSEGYFVYPEFRFNRGSIDAVFIRNGEAIVCEWKQLYKRSAPVIAEQTERMKLFAEQIQSSKHGFKSPIRKLKLLWVCDTWEPEFKNWWLGQDDKQSTTWPFKGWILGKADFPSFGDEWNPYSWLWAYRKIG
jgi:hypothetical protein